MFTDDVQYSLPKRHIFSVFIEIKRLKNIGNFFLQNCYTLPQPSHLSENMFLFLSLIRIKVLGDAFWKQRSNKLWVLTPDFMAPWSRQGWSDSFWYFLALSFVRKYILIPDKDQGFGSQIWKHGEKLRAKIRKEAKTCTCKTL